VTTVRLAHCGPPKALVSGLSEPNDKPALLVSYYYLQPFLKAKASYHFRDWVLDSGAFSAHNSGAEIKLQDFIDVAKRLKETDPQLTEVFALDVIGDWKASLKNCEEMWRQGVEAIPCYHVGEPEHVLKTIAREYPKIAFGGAVGIRGDRKTRWAEQAMARVWPKKVHGFGYGSERAILTVPFHSVDATNWEAGPCRFGSYKSFGGAQLSVRGSNHNLRPEVEWHLDLERRARKRWHREMAQLDDTAAPSVRLAVDAGSAGGRRAATAFAKPETP
jgi:hypothetical protein